MELVWLGMLRWVAKAFLLTKWTKSYGMLLFLFIYYRKLQYERKRNV